MLAGFPDPAAPATGVLNWFEEAGGFAKGEAAAEF